MKRIIMSIVVVMLFWAAGQAQRKSDDFSRLTPEKVKELVAQHMKFYEQEGGRREAAVKRQLLLQGLKHDGNQDDYDVRYYGIYIRLDHFLQYFTGTITAHIDYQIKSLVEGLNAVDLNLVNQLTVDSVEVEGKAAFFSHFSDLLSVTTPNPISYGQEFAMTVYYHGIPAYGYNTFFDWGGMAFSTWYGHRMCYTFCEPFASRFWWPCKDYPDDKPDSIDIYVERPGVYSVASNGVIVSDVDLGHGCKLVHYKHNYPIATYLVAISCSDFEVTSKIWQYDQYSMPVYSYSFPETEDATIAFDTLMVPILRNFSDAFGIYPFVTEKAGSALFGEPWLAMEHQTCPFYHPNWFDGSLLSDYVLIHENAHQWWGDMITCKTFNHIWLNEGFATYSEAVFYERQFGDISPDFYFWYMQGYKYLGPGTIYVENIFTDYIFDGALSYYKGAWVLHMLRGVVGDSLFFKALNDWALSDFRYGSATTEDFCNVVSNTVGSDMTWFFQEWIYGDGHPDYEISWECLPDSIGGGYQLAYCIDQIQEDGPRFKMPIRTTFVTTAGPIDTVIWNQGGRQIYVLPFADSVTNIVFDPKEWILRTIHVVPFTIHILPPTLPDGIVDQPYYQKLWGIGGKPPYHWTKISGDLPLGLTFVADTACVISGTPSWAATYFFNIKLQDSDSPPHSEICSYALMIDPRLPLCGDVDGFWDVNIADLVYLIAYLFHEGPPPVVLQTGDLNCGGSVNISDVVYLIQYIFSEGPPPCDSNNDGTPEC